MVLGKQSGILELTCGVFGGPIGHLINLISRCGGTVNNRSRLSDLGCLRHRTGFSAIMQSGQLAIILPGPLDVQAYRLPAEADGRRTDLSVVGLE